MAINPVKLIWFGIVSFLYSFWIEKKKQIPSHKFIDIASQLIDLFLTSKMVLFFFLFQWFSFNFHTFVYKSGRNNRNGDWLDALIEAVDTIVANFLSFQTKTNNKQTKIQSFEGRKTDTRYEQQYQQQLTRANSANSAKSQILPKVTSHLCVWPDTPAWKIKSEKKEVIERDRERRSFITRIKSPSAHQMFYWLWANHVQNRRKTLLLDAARGRWQNNKPIVIF